MPTPKERSRFTILVVEDERPIRELVVASLRKDGYRVLEATNPHDAIDILGSGLFEIHLLFADIMMPEMSGDQFAKELLEIKPSLKIIIATGSNYLELARDLEAIPHRYLQKPYTLEALREAVSALLQIPKAFTA